VCSIKPWACSFSES